MSSRPVTGPALLFFFYGVTIRKITIGTNPTVYASQLTLCCKLRLFLILPYKLDKIVVQYYAIYTTLQGLPSIPARVGGGVEHSSGNRFCTLQTMWYVSPCSTRLEHLHRPL
jgi:hypothetical protein